MNHNTTVPQVQRRKKEWNMYLTDDDKFRLSKQEILAKKKLLVSKNNNMHMEKTKSESLTSTPMRKFPHKIKSHYCSEEIGSRPKDFTSPSPFTICNSSQATTAHSEDSDNDFIDLASISNNQINDCNEKFDIFKEHSKENFSSLDLIEEEATKKDGAIKFNVKIKSPKKSKSLYSKQKTSTPLSKDVSTYFASDGNLLQSNNFQSDKFTHQSSNTANTMISENTYVQKHNVALVDHTYREIAAEIDVLRTELRYYEEISGRRSILDSKVVVFSFLNVTSITFCGFSAT